jgi:hypothetical protein
MSIKAGNLVRINDEGARYLITIPGTVWRVEDRREECGITQVKVSEDVDYPIISHIRTPGEMYWINIEVCDLVCTKTKGGNLIMNKSL